MQGHRHSYLIGANGRLQSLRMLRVGMETTLPQGACSSVKKWKVSLVGVGCRLFIGTGHVFRSVVVRPQMDPTSDSEPFRQEMFGEEE